MGRNKEAMIFVHERLRDQLNKNMEEAAQERNRQGLPVDLDELGWRAASTIERFVSQDPDKIVETAKKALEFGIITRETYDEWLADAELIRRVHSEQATPTTS